MNPAAGQRGAQLGLGAEAQARRAEELLPVVEVVVVGEVDHSVAYPGDLGPRADLAAVRQHDQPVRIHRVPPLPATVRRVAGVEHQPAAGHERPGQVGEGTRPLRIVDEELRDVAGQHRHVERPLRQQRRGALDPGHPLAARLGAGGGQGRAGRVDTGDGVAGGGEGNGQPAGAAAEVEHPGGRGLVDHRLEEVVVRPPPALGVVHLDQPVVAKLGVSHRGFASVAARTNSRTRVVVLLGSQTSPRSIGGASWIGTYATSGRG